MLSILDCLDRAHRTAKRWARAEALYLRSRETLRSAAWRVNVSRLILDYPHIRPICGGMDADSTTRDDVARTRIRELVASCVRPGLIPSNLYAGPSPGGHTCAACSTTIAKGQIEFEATLPGELMLYFDRRCADLWSQEVNGRLTI
jgi:hypothetical protein